MKAPTFPRTNTLTARALMRLLSGERITHRDFQDKTATYRLSSSIERLRNLHGWKIETIDEIALTSDPVPRVAKYGRYSIDPLLMSEYKQLLGERLPNFIASVRKFESRTINLD